MILYVNTLTCLKVLLLPLHTWLIIWLHIEFWDQTYFSLKLEGVTSVSSMTLFADEKFHVSPILRSLGLTIFFFLFWNLKIFCFVFGAQNFVEICGSIFIHSDWHLVAFSLWRVRSYFGAGKFSSVYLIISTYPLLMFPSTKCSFHIFLLFVILLCILRAFFSFIFH